MSATNKPNSYHRTLAWALVLLFTAVSVILNGLHAVMQWDGQEGKAFGAVLLAVMAPISLLMATHLLVGLIQDWTHRRRWLARLRGTVAAVFAVIGIIAFIMSFAALKDMAERYGMASTLSWMAPVIIDSVILAGTLAVVIAEAEMRLDREEAAAKADVAVQGPLMQADEADRSVVDQTDQAMVTVVTDHANQTDGLVTDHAAHAQTAHAEHADHEPGDHGDHVGAEHVDHGPAGRDNEVRGGDQSALTDEHLVVVAVATDHADQGDQVVTDHAEQGVTAQSDHADQTDRRTTDHVVDEATDHGDHAADQDLVSLAECVCRAKALDVPAGTVARALGRRLEGVAWRQIAEQVGVGSHNTVRRWVDAAADMDPAYAAKLAGKPRLVAVGTD